MDKNFGSEINIKGNQNELLDIHRDETNISWYLKQNNSNNKKVEIEKK